MTSPKPGLRIVRNADHPRGIVLDERTGQPVPGVRHVTVDMTSRRTEVTLTLTGQALSDLDVVPDAIRLEIESSRDRLLVDLPAPGWVDSGGVARWLGDFIPGASASAAGVTYGGRHLADDGEVAELEQDALRILAAIHHHRAEAAR